MSLVVISFKVIVIVKQYYYSMILQMVSNGETLIILKKLTRKSRDKNSLLTVHRCTEL